MPWSLLHLSVRDMVWVVPVANIIVMFSLVDFIVHHFTFDDVILLVCDIMASEFLSVIRVIMLRCV